MESIEWKHARIKRYAKRWDKISRQNKDFGQSEHGYESSTYYRSVHGGEKDLDGPESKTWTETFD